MASNAKSMGILGRKVGMTQVYDESGAVVPVTVLEAGPCRVLQVKTVDSDGYEAVQLGYLDKPRRLASRAERGHVAKLDGANAKKRAAAGIEAAPKAGCEPQRFIREFRGPAEDVKVGDKVDVGLLSDTVRVDVTAISKGRGFSGGMKRHNFSGQRATHGVKKCHRHAGGTGCSASPGRLFKGIRMAGQYGNKQITVRNQKVISVDTENNLIMICGGVPGPRTGYVVVRGTNMLK